MGDVASSLISASTEDVLREAAQEEVKRLTQEYRLGPVVKNLYILS